jgi:hypothetical protein
VYLLYRWLHVAWHVVWGHFSPNDQKAWRNHNQCKNASKLGKRFIHWQNIAHDPSLRHLCYEEGLIWLSVCFVGLSPLKMTEKHIKTIITVPNRLGNKL